MHKKTILSVIIPCYNEEKNLPELAERIMKTFSMQNIEGEIVFVDDASEDGTHNVMRRIADEYGSAIIVKKHNQNKGLFEAWKTGIKYSRGEYACFIDADLQNLPEDIARLYEEIQFTHADMVQGYRSSIGRVKDSRYYLSRGLNLLLNLFFGMRAKDNKSGFIIASKEVLEDVLRFRYSYYYPQSFIAVSARAKGYTIREIETIFQGRLYGESSITKNPVKPTLLSFADLTMAFFEFKVFFKKENILADFLRDHKPQRQDHPLSWWRKSLFNFYFLTLPLHVWMLSRNTKQYYFELKKGQWLSPGEIREFQLLKLRQLMRHAYQHSRYYRKLFDSRGIKPQDIRNLTDLQKLPLLDKDAIRENLYFGLLSDNYDKNKILKISTSGSTGIPFVCYADQHQLDMRWAATLRSMEWTGYQFGDRQMRLWHQTLGMTWTQIAREYLDAMLSRRKFISAYQMTGNNINKFVKALNRYKPALIDGYAESFNFLASYLNSQDMNGLHSPKGIISSAQSLPDQSRAIIEKVFKCSVFDKYGSREFSGIAYESNGHDGHLVVAENYIVEIIKDGRQALPGEVGEVVITDLNNYCMPFIRYRVGDLAVATDDTKVSPCGRGLPRIGTIEGRVQAIIVGKNGNFVPGTFFAHLYKDYGHIIRQYKVIQEEDGSVTLQIVKTVGFNDDEFNKLIGIHREFLGKDTSIRVEFVKEIPMVRTGKQQGSVSRLKIDFQKIKGNIIKRYPDHPSAQR